MCRRKLEQLKSLQKEIRDTEKRIGKIKGKRGLHVTNAKYSKYLKRQEEVLNEIKIKSMEMETDIIEWISSIEDSEMRRIMMFRYIDDMTWQQVAMKMQESDESYPRRKHNDFMKAAENAERNIIQL